MSIKITPPECPIDPVRMAWPFKTEKERELLQKWYKQTELFEKRKKKKEILSGETALL